MRRYFIALVAATASLAVFGYKFGTLQWTSVPDWAEAASFPTESGAPLNSGHLTALALLRDGGLERQFAGLEDFDPVTVNIEPPAEFALIPQHDYEDCLQSAQRVFYRDDLWASTYCPDFPTFGFCMCTNINAHNPGNLQKLGCCAANLDTSGVIYPKSWDDAYYTNFVNEVEEAFGFTIKPSRNPFGVRSAMAIVRSNHPNAKASTGVGNTIQIAPVQNALTLLPYFDRSYDIVDEPALQGMEGGELMFAEHEVYRRIERVFEESGPFEPGKNQSVECGNYYDEVDSTGTNDTMKGTCRFSFTSSIGVVDVELSAAVFSPCSVARPDDLPILDWEESLPTVEQVSRFPTVMSHSEDGDISYHRGDFGGTNDWSQGEYNARFKVRFSSSSTECSTSDVSIDYYDIPMHPLPGYWKQRVLGEKYFMRLSSERRDFINGERQSPTNIYHAIAGGQELRLMYQDICDKTRANSVNKPCEMNMPSPITLHINAKGIDEKPDQYAPVYKISHSELQNEPDKKVHPCGIMLAHGGGDWVEDTDFMLAGAADIEIDLTDRSESDVTETIPGAILRQIDWNFQSLVK